jgi:hypothetical protein
MPASRNESPEKFPGKLYWDQCEIGLSYIAPLMDRLIPSPESTFTYDLLSGGILWPDEFPDFRVLRTVRNWGVVRFLLRFRTTLILGHPDEELRPCWDRGQELFPSWPGFDPHRRSTSLRPAVLEIEAAAHERLEEELRQFEE